MANIRVRFAPSPTGEPHLGSIRTALFDYLLAKSVGGDFVLRVEDTDRSRFVEGSLERMLESLEWLGISPNEGVIWEKGEIQEKGEYGPYYQSKRLELYKKYVLELVKKDLAYYCFCTPERLEEMRQKAQAEKKPPKYDRLCLNLSKEEVENCLKNGEKYVIRLKVPGPENKKIFFHDALRGDIEVEAGTIDDQVLLKTDGFPTYHLAVVVDDYLMKITDVLRGEEWISSTPKHIILYDGLGIESFVPNFVHLPVVLGPDKSKLSKRHGAKTVLEYRSEGYLPEALVNILALLGWAPGEDREIMSLETMSKIFKLEDINKASPVFDIQKLNHFNGLYIRKLSVAELADRLLEWAPDSSRLTKWAGDRNYFEKALKTIQERMVMLADAEGMLEFYFEEPKYAAKLLDVKRDKREKGEKWEEEVRAALEASLTSLSSLSSWTLSDLETNLRGLAEKLDIKAGQVLWPIRVALTGLEKSPSTFELLEVLGQQKSQERISQAIKLLNKS